MRAPDRLHACLGHAEVLHLPLLNQIFDHARDVLDRDCGIDAVLVVEIDHVGAEPLERALDTFSDDLGPAVLSLLAVHVLDAELGGDHHLFSERLERFTHELFILIRTVDLGGIEERGAALERRADERDHRLLVGRRAVALAHPHAAEAEGGDFEALTELALLHIAPRSRVPAIPRLYRSAAREWRCASSPSSVRRRASAFLPARSRRRRPAGSLRLVRPTAARGPHRR